MEDIKKLAAMTALNNMLQGEHFSICTINNVATMLGLPRCGCDAYKTLRALHCIDYAKMPKELRDAIPGLIQQVLDVNPGQAKSSGFPKLLGLKP